MLEERAVFAAAKEAGALDAFTISEPFAAALGAGLPVWGAAGSMIIDIGGGTTEVAVISMGGVVTSKSIRVAGDRMDEAIINYIREKYRLLIGDRTAESIKMNVGAAGEVTENIEMDIRGRDLLTGLPKAIVITAKEITFALQDTVEKIVGAVKEALEGTPPELAADIIDRGVVLSGGGALLKNIDKVLSKETEIPVFIADEPLDCVAIGTGKSIEYIQHFQEQGVASRSSLN